MTSMMTLNDLTCEIQKIFKNEKRKLSSASKSLILEKIKGYDQQQQTKIMLLKQKNNELKKNSQDNTDRTNDLLAFTIHELRTPLTAIKAYADLLILSPVLETKIEEVSRIIDMEADRLTKLINDLLDLLKLSSGEMIWHWEMVNLKNSINKALNLLKVLADSAKIKIKLKIEPEDLILKIDQNKIIQVFTNLIMNAIKFSLNNGTILVKAEVVNINNEFVKKYQEQLKYNDNYILVSVADQGKGIKVSDQKILFHKFKQVPGQKGRYKGTGLGLIITRKIIEYLGGVIWLESEYRKGTKFYFLIPYDGKI